MEYRNNISITRKLIKSQCEVFRILRFYTWLRCRMIILASYKSDMSNTDTIKYRFVTQFILFFSFHFLFPFFYKGEIMIVVSPPLFFISVFKMNNLTRGVLYNIISYTKISINRKTNRGEVYVFTNNYEQAI